MVVGGSSPAVIPIPLVAWGFLNAYLIRAERAIVVDAGYPQLAGGLVRALERLGTKPRDVSLILLTHGHLDHLGGVTHLREHFDAPVALHRADAEIARSGRDRPLKGTDLFGRAFALVTPRTAPPFEPDVVHDGELDLGPYGVSGRTVPTPGHTPGSVSVIVGDDAICGDLLAGRALQRRAPRLPYFADDLAAIDRSVRDLLVLAPGRWHVGHRGPLPAEQVEAWITGRTTRG